MALPPFPWKSSDTNLGAKALYKRVGYRKIATHTMGPFSRLFGFRTTCRMMKMIEPNPGPLTPDFY